MRNDEIDGGTLTPQSDDDVWATLVRFSRTPLSAEDRAALERWSAEDATRRDMVRAVQRLATVVQRPRRSGRAQSAWARVRTRLAEGEAPMAAPDASDALGTPDTLGTRDVLDARDTHRRTPPPFRALTRTRDRAEAARRRRRRTIAAVATALAACLVVGIVARDEVRALVMELLPAPPMRELVTRAGERADVHLEDGSRVVLAPMSRLRYGRLVGPRTRSVELEGEGYFDVAHDAKRPFIVTARHAAVQAVGTAFSVRAYAGDTAVEVITTEGRVALRPATGERGTGTLVERGELGTLSETGIARVTPGADVERVLAWTSGRLSYQLVPLGVVAGELERWYDVEIEIVDPELEALRVTLTLEGETVEDVAERLKGMLGEPVERHGREMRIGRR